MCTWILLALTVLPVANFEAVELRDGGHVVIRQGTAQRVTLVSGDRRSVDIEVSGQRLVIQNTGRHRRHDERLKIEIVTPALTAVAVSGGGMLETDGPFSVQSSIAASVEQGGTIDIRSVAADDVTAAVDSGGRIFTHPRATLTASVRSGGSIKYWGEPRVTRSVRHGGVVAKGTARDADTPLSELDTEWLPVPPVPPVPPHH